MTYYIFFRLEQAKQEEQAVLEPYGGKCPPREKSPEHPKTVCET